VHFDGFQTAVYFAKFPSNYLRILREVNIDSLNNLGYNIKLCHTRLYNLFNTFDRTEFIWEFVALLRFVASGEANVGFLRNDDPTIHRVPSAFDFEEESVQDPPQEDMSDAEKDSWRRENAQNYTA